MYACSFISFVWFRVTFFQLQLNHFASPTLQPVTEATSDNIASIDHIVSPTHIALTQSKPVDIVAENTHQTQQLPSAMPSIAYPQHVSMSQAQSSRVDQQPYFAQVQSYTQNAVQPQYTPLVAQQSLATSEVSSIASTFATQARSQPYQAASQYSTPMQSLPYQQLQQQLAMSKTGQQSVSQSGYRNAQQPHYPISQPSLTQGRTPYAPMSTTPYTTTNAMPYGPGGGYGSGGGNSGYNQSIGQTSGQTGGYVGHVSGQHAVQSSNYGSTPSQGHQGYVSRGYAPVSTVAKPATLTGGRTTYMQQVYILRIW